MKKLLFLLLACLTVGTALAQVPQKLSYEAIVRDSAFVALDSVQVGIQLSLVSDTTSGTPVYTETHTPTTGRGGLVQLLIGTGTSTDTFSSINWADGPYFLMTKIDPAGGTDYTISGVTEMLAVPYASESVSATHADTVGRSGALNFRVSQIGDSLILENGEFLIIPGLSALNAPPVFPEGFVHCDPDNPTVIKTVKSTTGRVWMDRNLGASRVAQSSDDSLAFGDFFQWGRFADGHQCRNSDTTSTLATSSATPGGDWDGKFVVSPDSPKDWLSPQDSNLWQGVNGVNNPCPTEFRLPTEAEWQTELDSYNQQILPVSSVFTSPLKLPSSGLRFNTNQVSTNSFFYWSSEASGSNARAIYDSSGFIAMNDNARAFGLPVRCIKDQP